MSPHPVHVLLASLLVVTGACKTNVPVPLQRFEFSQAQMGLDFRITLFAENEAFARTAATAAYDRITALNGILSDYDPDSELSRFSQSSGSGEWVPLSPELWQVLATGQHLAQQTAGAFDLTVGPSVNLWRRARRQQALPSPDLLLQMRERTGHSRLLLDASGHRAQLTRPSMRLDAGGIAKGYALDEALAVLRKQGIEHAMIHAGGDMIFGKPPPGRSGWTVDLPPADATGHQILSLANQALATSGDLSQFVEIDGVRYSHIVDPRTGYGLTNRTLVNVIAPQGITADSLATALSVLGSEGMRSLLARYPDVHCQIIRGTNSTAQVVASPGFARFLTRP